MAKTEILARAGLGGYCIHCGRDVRVSEHAGECFVRVPIQFRDHWKNGKYDAERGIDVVMNQTTPEGSAYHKGRACAHKGTPAPQQMCPSP